MNKLIVGTMWVIVLFGLSVIPLSCHVTDVSGQPLLRPAFWRAQVPQPMPGPGPIVPVITPPLQTKIVVPDITPPADHGEDELICWVIQPDVIHLYYGKPVKVVVVKTETKLYVDDNRVSRERWPVVLLFEKTRYDVEYLSVDSKSEVPIAKRVFLTTKRP